MKFELNTDWQTFLNEEFEKDYFKMLHLFLEDEYANHTVYPPKKDLFSAFNNCPLANVKVIIIGQDPYHGKDQANGMSFSVPKDVNIPPSLRNIFKELHNDLNKTKPSHGDLSNWAEQGVLLLNATLSVRAAKAGSHHNKGWGAFTDAIIQKLSDQKKDLVFILWGEFAQKKASLIDTKKHHVITAAHPSPLAAHRGFFGSKPFSKANTYLSKRGLSPIKW